MLQHFAAAHNVKLVAVSIGGNNFNFAGIVQTCVEDFLLTPEWWPATTAAKKARSRTTSRVQQRRDEVKGEIKTAILNVAQAMTNAGYSSSQYTILVQDYPSPIPNGARLPLLPERLHAPDDRRLRLLEHRRQLRQLDDAADDRQHRARRGRRDRAVERQDDGPVCGVQRAAAVRERRRAARGRGPVVAGQPPARSTRPSGSTRSARSTAIFPPYEIQEDMHPNYWAQLALRNCLHAGLQRRRAEGRHVHDLRDRAQLSGRAEHVTALIGQRGRRPHAGRRQARCGALHPRRRARPMAR